MSKVDKSTQDATSRGVEVLLLQPHIHAGKTYQAGDIITVSQSQQSWLAKRGIVAASGD